MFWRVANYFAVCYNGRNVTNDECIRFGNIKEVQDVGSGFARICVDSSYGIPFFSYNSEKYC